MNWTALGSIIPTISWSFSPDFQSEVIRITHSVSVPSYPPRALIAQFYGTSALSTRRIYGRSGASELIEVPIPSDLKAEGVTSRKIGIMLLPPRWLGIFTTDWTIQIEALDRSVEPLSLAGLKAEIDASETAIRADIAQLGDDFLGL